MSALIFTTPFITKGVCDWRKGLLCLVKPQALQPAIHALLEKCEALCGGYITIRLDSPHRPRSTGPRSASAHFHGHCQTIAEDTGGDFEDVKLAIKRRAMRRGYPVRMKNGKVVYSLVDGLPLPQSEADASVEQENMLIEEAHQTAAEMEIILVETSD